MTPQEGVITFQLKFRKAPPIADANLRKINAWRNRLRGAHLLGQDPSRYDGYGFGNISRRTGPRGLPPHSRPFLITGSQTGGIELLTGAHYATVRECHADQNLIVAEGPTHPSSESLTHGTLYAIDDALRWVMHVHAPDLWRHADILEIPITHSSVPYGSPEMAQDVGRLLTDTDVRERHLFSMGGHKDGLVAFGQTAKEAGSALFAALERVRRLGP